MAKLVLLLFFGCFQFSLQEEVGLPKFELISDKIPTIDIELLDGEDKNQWHYEKEENKFEQLDGEDENQWKPEAEDDLDDLDDLDDDKLEQLDGEDENQWNYEKEEDLDDDSEYSEEDDKWWDYEDYDSSEYMLSKYPYYTQNGKYMVGQNNILNLYYSWLYQINIGKGDKKTVAKRFSSV